MAEEGLEEGAGRPVPEAGAFFDLSSDLLAIVSRNRPAWLRTNAAFERLLGWQDEDLRGELVDRLVHPDDQSRLQGALARVPEEEVAAPVELQLLKAGGGYQPTLWRFFFAPPGDALLCVGRQVSAHDEEQLHAQINRLRNEIEHRVRNNFAVIRAIIRRSSENSEYEQALAHLQGRIDAFARVQSRFRLSGGNAQGINLASLIEDELLAQSMREGDALTIDGPYVAISPRAAEALALAVHELAMNAIKFGAFCVRGGRVEVRWQVLESDDGQRLLLAWTESGVPLGEQGTPNEGFGMETLQRALPYELAAETSVKFTPDGLHFTLSAPLERIAGRPRSS